jgi:hypothetical protein
LLPADDDHDRPIDRKLVVVAVGFWVLAILVCCGAFGLLRRLNLPDCWLGC